MLTRTGRRCLFILLDKFQINSAKKQRADWYPVAVTNWREAAPLKYFLWRLNLCRLLQTFFSVLHRYHWTNPLLSKRRELCTWHISVMPTDVYAHVWFSLLEPSWAEIYLHQPGGPTLLFYSVPSRFWPHSQSPAGLMQLASALPTCHSTGGDYRGFLITAEILISCQSAHPQAPLLFSVVPRHISYIDGSSPGAVTLGLLHAMPIWGSLVLG